MMEINIHLCSSGTIIAEEFYELSNDGILKRQFYWFISELVMTFGKNPFYEKCAYIRFYYIDTLFVMAQKRG
jgi:hypothetical protein